MVSSSDRLRRLAWAGLVLLATASARAELPAGASAEQRAQFGAGEGGELAPLMCVDKSAADALLRASDGFLSRVIDL